METRRAPDPFRPGDVPEGRPFQKIGRPSFAALVIALVVLTAVAVLVIAVLR